VIDWQRSKQMMHTSSRLKRMAKRPLKRPVKIMRTMRKILKRRINPMRKGYDRRFDMSIRQWLLHHQRTIHFEKCSWMGIRSLKNPCDAWIYQEIICDVKPDI